MSLFPSLDNIEDEDEPKIEGHLNITFSTIEYTYDTFVNKLLSGDMSDYQIQQDIYNHYDRYCNYDNFQNPRFRGAFKKIWTNKRFLNNFITVLIKNKEMKPAIGLYNRFICKIAYDYYTDIMRKTGAEDEISGLLFEMVRILNEDKIIPLTNYMYDSHALLIVLAANSSFEYAECVNRVNYFIIKALQDIDIVQIIDIYSKVFNGGRFTIIFNATMSDLAKPDMTPPEGAMYAKITKAIFIILNSIPSKEIEKVIRGYKNNLAINNKPQRTDIITYIEEYPRAKEVFDMVWYD